MFVKYSAKCLTHNKCLLNINHSSYSRSLTLLERESIISHFHLSQMRITKKKIQNTNNTEINNKSGDNHLDRLACKRRIKPGRQWKNNPDTKHSWNKRSGTSEECGMLKKLFILDRILDLAMWLYTRHLYLKVYSISNKPCSWQNSIPTSTKSIFSRCSPVSWTENLKSNSWAFFLPHLPCIIHQEMLGLLLVHL